MSTYHTNFLYLLNQDGNSVNGKVDQLIADSAAAEAEATNDGIVSVGEHFTVSFSDPAVDALYGGTYTYIGHDPAYSGLIAEDAAGEFYLFSNDGDIAIGTNMNGFIAEDIVPPANVVPGPQTVDEDTALAIAGVSVADTGSSTTLTTTLSVQSGTLDVAAGGGAAITGMGTATVVISGTAAQVNAALAGLTYQGDLNFYGSDTLTVTTDGAFIDTDTVPITVNPVDDPAVPQNDHFTVAENAVVGGASNVFADNGSGPDVDVDGPSFQVIAVNGSALNVGRPVTLASGAVLTLNADGSISYDPHGAFDSLPAMDSGASNTTADDSFTYTVTGGASATVTVTVTGVDSKDILLGTAGDDRMNAGIDDDVLYGLDGADTLIGGTGNDTLVGGEGNDTLRGGAGDDTYYVTAGDVIVEAPGYGTDTVRAYSDFALAEGVRVERLVAQSSTAVSLTGNSNANELYGNDLDNILSGGGGNDRLEGRGGSDTLIGGTGNDTYVIDDAGDRIVEAAGEGNDVAYAKVDYTLAEGVAVERLVALSTTGLSLGGNSGANAITGGAGDDILNGHGGRDVLVGRAGADTFVFTALGDSVASMAGRDIISDFHRLEGDKIDLSALDADAGTPGHQDFHFIGTAQFSGTAGELRYTAVDSYAVVSVDVNGDKVADFEVQLTGVAHLATSDFLGVV